MGFNKRFVGRDNILGVYDVSSINGLKEYLFKPDVILFTDNFSGKIYDLLDYRKDELAEKKIKKELTIRC